MDIKQRLQAENQIQTVRFSLCFAVFCLPSESVTGHGRDNKYRHAADVIVLLTIDRDGRNAIAFGVLIASQIACIRSVVIRTLRINRTRVELNRQTGFLARRIPDGHIEAYGNRVALKAQIASDRRKFIAALA